MALSAGENAEEFDCVECGRHIIALPYDVWKMKMCAMCLHMPGWFNDPKLRKMLDPEYTPPWDTDQ